MQSRIKAFHSILIIFKVTSADKHQIYSKLTSLMNHIFPTVAEANNKEEINIYIFCVPTMQTLLPYSLYCSILF